MAEKVSLEISVNAETGQLDVLGAKFQGLTEKAKKAEESFLGLKGESAKLLQTTLGFASAGGIVAFFAAAVKGAEAENESMRRLKGTLESTGQSWEKSAQSIDQWSKQIQQATRFSDGQALEVLDKLARSTRNVAQAQSASQLAMDLSVRSGKSLVETTDIVNQLINKKERAINAATLAFGNLAGGATTAQGVLDELAKSVGGASEKEESLTKSTEQAKNAFGELSDTIGTTFAPAALLIADGLKGLISVIRGLGTALAGEAMVIASTWKNMWAILKADNWKDLKQGFSDLVNDIKTGVQVTVEDVFAGEEKKTDAIKAAAAQRVQTNQNATAQETRDKEDALRRLEEMDFDLDQRVARLGEQTYQKKLAEFNAEVAARRAKVTKEMETEKAGQDYIRKLNDFERAGKIQLAKDEVFVKQEAAFQVANLAIQTLQIVNSLGNSGSSAERTRAKALLALQQAIAIGWAWVHASRIGGPYAPVIAAAQTAVLVAQFAQGVKNIDKAGEREASGLSAITIDAPVAGIDSFGGSSGVSRTSGGSFGGSSTGGAPSGGGAGTVINVGGVFIDFKAGPITVENVDEMMMKMTERVRQGVVEGVQLARTLQNSAAKNQALGV